MIRIVMFSTDKWTSMHGDEGIVLSGKEHVIIVHLYTHTAKGTWKFSCTLTQITWKEERGNFHVP